jgi:Flp pilus assembly protein CpaB
MTAQRRILLAAVCGAAAALGVGLFLWNQAQTGLRARRALYAQFEGGASKALVARVRIEPGTLITQQHFAEEPWPALLLPEGALKPQQATAIIGTRARTLIVAGEVLTEARLFEEVLPLDRLAVGMTAVTLSTDAVHALGGELLRGMRVTLMASLTDGRVEALADDLEVLSANTAVAASEAATAEAATDATARKGLLGGSGGASGQSGGDIQWVTLAIPEDKVTQVLAAANANTLHLVLPKADDELSGLGLEETGAADAKVEQSLEPEATDETSATGQ